jgi:protein phosphatase
MEALSAPAADRDAATSLAQAFSEADAALHRARASDPEVAAMATTLIAAVVDNRSLYLAHVGDSRAYLLHDGELSQLTRDHTVAQQMVDDGVLKPEQRDRAPFAHVLARAMDGGGRTPEVSTIDWVPGDRLLLCSDGLNAALGEDTIGVALGAVDPETAVAKLVDACNRAGGPDNITVIVLELF